MYSDAYPLAVPPERLEAAMRVFATCQLRRPLGAVWRCAKDAAAGDTKAGEWARRIGDPVDDESAADRAARALLTALVRGGSVDLAELAHVFEGRSRTAIDPAVGALAWAVERARSAMRGSARRPEASVSR